MPIAERQAHWIADHLRGEYRLPAAAELRADIERDRAAMFRRYVKSKRHTMQIDYDEYMYEVEKERRAGAERARAAGFALPVPARAAQPAPAPA